MTKIKVQREWTKEDVRDFFSDFIGIDIKNSDSTFRVARDFEDFLIDSGVSDSVQVSEMGDGVEKFLKKIISNIPKELK